MVTVFSAGVKGLGQIYHCYTHQVHLRVFFSGKAEFWRFFPVTAGNCQVELQDTMYSFTVDLDAYSK